jgi:hypothetical protein
MTVCSCLAQRKGLGAFLKGAAQWHIAIVLFQKDRCCVVRRAGASEQNPDEYMSLPSYWHLSKNVYSSIGQTCLSRRFLSPNDLNFCRQASPRQNSGGQAPVKIVGPSVVVDVLFSLQRLIGNTKRMRNLACTLPEAWSCQHL